MVRDKINCVEDWLHSGNVADMGKKSEDESGNSRRCVDIGSGIAQGTGTGKSAIEACQQNIAQGIGLFRTGGARSLAENKVIGTAESIG